MHGINSVLKATRIPLSIVTVKVLLLTCPQVNLPDPQQLVSLVNIFKLTVHVYAYCIATYSMLQNLIVNINY